ncbi:MAG: LacI family DNA-binding transcriptional regulator [Lentisphaeria bacterium]|nr:LacI family DNA-binding transcriptional regulator [Lentisphaeria bacterium]
MITIKEIARLAGVSAKTAERALSGVTKDKRCDAKERADRVRRIAAEHGYRPSELALSLRRGSSRTLGIMVDILTDQFLAASVETAMDAAGRSGYKTSLQIVRFSPERTADAMEFFLSSGVEGIIGSCTSEQLPEAMMNSLTGRGFPYFSLCGRSEYEVSSASPDYKQALPDAVKYLADRGHKRIILALFKGKKYDNALSAEIFDASCKKYGVIPECRIHSDCRQAAELAAERPEAVILYGKYSMRMYMDKCSELGNIPDTVGIFNEWTLAAALHFPLCGVILEDAEHSVRQAIAQILTEIRGAARQHLQIPARFIPAESTGKLKVVDLANQRFSIQE